MNIFLTLKLSEKDASYFIEQFSKQENVGKVIVFRDKNAKPIQKVEYVTSIMPKLGKVNLFFRLVQIISRKSFNPAVIVGIYEIPHGLLAVLAGKLIGRPSIVSIIGNPAYVKIRRKFRMKVTMWMIRLASCVTVTGSSSRKFLISRGVPSKKVFILPNTLDFTEYRRIEGIRKEYDIVCLGRLSSEKRMEQVISIVNKIKEKNPEIKAAIGGSGPEKEFLERLIRQNKLENSIKLSGYIGDKEQAAFFSKGKVFVLTSETEGFPRTIIQAAACGTPVVASKVGDITDVIEHGINGFLVDRWDDTDSYVEHISNLLSNPTLSLAFSEALNKKVRLQFSNEQAMVVWENILGGLN